MPEITVCIPAYRSERFVAQTLRFVQLQTFTDFVVDVALEPEDAEATERACRPYLEDPRFILRRNESVLGWDRNTRSLLARVDSPYFVVLPHDDMWHPRYLATLHAALRDRPDATVAYSDLYVFGHESGSRWLDLPDAGLVERLLAFFLGGAEAVPWRGLARRESLDRPFPVNDFRGFAVECEWTLHLLTGGVALRTAEPLYFKRSRAEAASVSWGWGTDMPEETLRRGLEHHRERMLAGIPSQVDEPARVSLELAAEAAMLRRWVIFSGGRFGMTSEQLGRAGRVLAASNDLGSRGSQIRAVTLLALARDRDAHGDRVEAERLAYEAVEAAPDRWEPCFYLGELLLRLGYPHEAARLIVRAGSLAPMDPGIPAVQAEAGRRLSLLS